MRYDIVDAHCDTIDPDRIEFSGFDGQHQLRADSVRTRYKHRFFVVQFRKVKVSAESADFAKNAWTFCAVDVFLDAAYCFITGCDIHTRFCICVFHQACPPFRFSF
ncbi:hypothetical protein SDC9_155789 [bioreactor metagenome]|uniref:Uncharacterized protein n=1 Tax=bioreactor metagenome TaxID=1076179 RepID=A0A645F2R3_9ZZZZ